MDYRMKRIASCLLAGAIVISGTGVGTYGAQTGGVSAVIATGLSSNGSPAAGFSKMLSQCLIESDKAVAEAAAQAEEQVSENDVPVVASEYADIAIAQVDNYVNVRSEPNTDSEVLGKLYNNSAATVLETTEDGWYKITSGSVTGYVKCEYVVTGDEELAKKVSTRYATVTTTTLYVRMEPSTEAGILTMLGEGDDFVVVDDSMKDSGWVIVTTEEGDGYVSTDYVNLWTDYVTAESKAEEEARLAKEEAERKNQRDAVFQKWDREAEELKRFYPQFDLQTEIQDQRFLDLMGAGINMRTIYETLHHDEIIPALMQQTAKATAKQQAAAVQSGQMRPAENGMSSHPAAQIVKDPAKMTKEERQEYARRAARGEIITFRE